MYIIILTRNLNECPAPEICIGPNELSALKAWLKENGFKVIGENQYVRRGRGVVFDGSHEKISETSMIFADLEKLVDVKQARIVVNV